MAGQREVSQVLHKVFAALRTKGITRDDIADAIAVHPNDINELVFGLALTALDGSSRKSSGSTRPQLTAVTTKK